MNCPLWDRPHNRKVWQPWCNDFFYSFIMPKNSRISSSADVPGSPSIYPALSFSSYLPALQWIHGQALVLYLISGKNRQQWNISHLPLWYLAQTQTKAYGGGKLEDVDRILVRASLTAENEACSEPAECHRVSHTSQTPNTLEERVNKQREQRNVQQGTTSDSILDLRNKNTAAATQFLKCIVPISGKYQCISYQWRYKQGYNPWLWYLSNNNMGKWFNALHIYRLHNGWI